MIQIHQNVKKLITITVALASVALALLWPRWRDELRAQYYPPPCECDATHDLSNFPLPLCTLPLFPCDGQGFHTGMGQACKRAKRDCRSDVESDAERASRDFCLGEPCPPEKPFCRSSGFETSSLSFSPPDCDCAFLPAVNLWQCNVKCSADLLEVSCKCKRK
jgi:hypothetical protein